MPKEIAISEDGFINALRSLNGGSVVEELDRELAKGIGAIFDHGGASTITVKISVKRIRNMESAVSIDHDVMAKHPKEERPTKAMFVNLTNGLTDQPQQQTSMNLGDAVDQRKSTLQESTTEKVTRLHTQGVKS